MGDTKKAKKGHIWVCLACGKTSQDQYGDEGSLWDASCMMNSVECETNELVFGDTGRVISVGPFETDDIENMPTELRQKVEASNATIIRT